MGAMLLMKGAVSGEAVPISELTDYFAKVLDRPVFDETGLKGKYDFRLRWMATAFPQRPDSDLSTALAQLGLKLEPRDRTIPVLVVDHVDNITAPVVSGSPFE